MEKVKIEYERYTELELLEAWKRDKTEWRVFLEKTGLNEEEINKAIEEEEVLQYLNEIEKYARGCDLYLCLQCSCFVESNAYLQSHQHCLQCAIDNGF